MLNNQIKELRYQLDRMVASNADYSKIYEMSVKMDELILRYYKSDEYNTRFQQ